MKIYVEMTEEEYDFYKEFKKDKRIITDNLKKLYIEYLKESESILPDARQQIEKIYTTLNKYLLTLFEIKEDAE